MSSLLPPNATKTERDLEAVTSRLASVPMSHGDLWNPATCPAHLLPWLAWALSVDDWDDSWTDETKRQAIAQSTQIHRQKGTIAGLRRALGAAGLGDGVIIERFGQKFYDGTIPRNGTVNRERPDHWAEYRVVLTRRLSTAQAALARQIIEASAPARCHLKELDFRRAPNLYGDRIARDGSYTRGAA